MPSPSGAAGREELTFPDSGTCFGCSRNNPHGLGLRFFRDGASVLCVTAVPATYQGARGIVHGGMQAVLLDEVSCAAAFFTTGSYVVTGSLAMRYRRPCPIERSLEVRGTVVAEEKRFFIVRSEIRLPGIDEVLTTAEGRFYRDRARNAETAP
jgi:acyl-coenzyme A thioesterase PaaI-like protein